MKIKIITALLIPLTTVSIVVAAPLDTNPSEEKVDETGRETFFYNKGYRNGYDEGQRKGFSEGLAEAKKSLEKYKNNIKALEAGKYISNRNKITPPKLYQQKNQDGTVSVIVKGCTIEKQLSPSEILMLPEADASYSGSESYSSGNMPIQSQASNTPSDNVFLPGIDHAENPSLGGEDIKVVYKFFHDTEFYRKLFRASSRPYSIVGGDKIKVIFPSAKEADEFIVRHNLTPGKDVF